MEIPLFRILEYFKVLGLEEDRLRKNIAFIKPVTLAFLLRLKKISGEILDILIISLRVRIRVS
jgi:hypothetical protein